MKKIDLLNAYLDLYIDPFKVLNSIKNKNTDIDILDIRNAPKEVKKNQIKGSTALPVKNLYAHLKELDKNKTYVVYDWTGGSILGKKALKMLLSSGFNAYELAGALEGWNGMNLPIEPAK